MAGGMVHGRRCSHATLTSPVVPVRALAEAASSAGEREEHCLQGDGGESS